MMTLDLHLTVPLGFIEYVRRVSPNIVGLHFAMWVDIFLCQWPSMVTDLLSLTVCIMLHYMSVRDIPTKRVYRLSDILASVAFNGD